MNGVSTQKPFINVLGRLSSKLSRKEVLKRVKKYGFIECGEIVSFLTYACNSETLDAHALRYVYGKVAECLATHPVSDADDSMCYFQDLRVLKGEIEFIISLRM